MRNPYLASLAMLALVLAAGCGNNSSTGKGKEDVKTYTSEKKPDASKSTQNSNNPNQVLNMPAETTNGKASRASDTGEADAVKGQPVVTPGAPVATEPKQKQSAPAAGH